MAFDSRRARLVFGTVTLSEKPAQNDGKLVWPALAVIESCRHRYSKNRRPAPTLSIHQNRLGAAAATNRTVSPFENLAAARCPLITTSSTTAPASDR